jgi:hypothetical protein
MMNNGRAEKKRTGIDERKRKTKKKTVILILLPCLFGSEGFLSFTFLE